MARCCNFLVDMQLTNDAKKDMAFKGLAYADRAYSIAPHTALPNKWKGILTSTVGNYRELKEKIAGAYVIREHIQRAIDLDPTDPYCHNILGQWCLAFANMTWLEKRAASALFGTPPTATYEDAVWHFTAAEKVCPGFWKKNAYLLAETYHKMKQMEVAREWLLKAQELEVKTVEDAEVHVELWNKHDLHMLDL